MPESPVPQPLPLLQILANLRHGSIINEVQGELARVVKGVTLCGKAGKVTITLNINPVAQIPHAVFIAAEVGAKIPKPPRGADMLFADAQAGLHHNDPRQMDAFENMKPRLVGTSMVDTRSGEVLENQA